MELTSYHFILLFFRLLLTIVAAINGHKIAKSAKLITWKSFLPVIIIFSLYSGLRWGRGIDYNIYYYTYLAAMQGNIDFSRDFIWNVILWLYTSLKLPWQALVFSMSVVLIISGCYFLKRFRPYLAWLLPAFVLGSSLSENLARWYMAFSFVLIGFSWLLDGKWKKYVIWCSVGFFIHYGIIVNVLFFFIIFITFNKRLLKPLNSLVIYTIFFVFFSAEWMEALIPFVESINLGTRYLSYQQNAEFWLTGGAAESQGLSWGNFVMAVFTIFGGYYVVNSYFKEKSFVILYNLVMVGLFLQPLGKQIELVFRIQELFNLFNKLFYALIFYAYLNHQRTRIALLKPIVLVIGFYTIYYYTTDYVFKLKENQTYFVWDSKGRSSLPIGELKD